VKLSYVHGVGTTALIAGTIGGALNGAAERWGNRDALVACHQQLRYSYRELRHEADRGPRADCARRAARRPGRRLER
jgi:fatty-acyl-CoA synthase